jgi:SAM-dependent methyltransferase
MKAALTRYLERVYRATDEENRRAILDAVPSMPGCTLLDLGCGDGEFTMRIAERAGAARVLGAEFVPDFAAQARARGIEAEVVDLGGRLPWDDAAADLVHSNQVIEHLPKTDNFLREIRRVLRPGGRAIVSTNNLSSWHNVASLIAGVQPTPCHVSDEVIVGSAGANFAEGNASHTPGQTHLRVFTGRALAGLAAHHGLALERDLGVGYYPLMPSAARKLADVDRKHAAYLVQVYRPA